MVAFNLIPMKMSLPEFPVEKQTRACTGRPIGKMNPGFPQIGDTLNVLRIAFCQKNPLFSPAKIDNSRYLCPDLS